MPDDARSAPAPIVVRRYPLLGGAAGWYVPILAAVLAAGAMAFEAYEVAMGAGALGWAAHRLTRSVVVELSPTGLTRGVLALGAFRAHTTVIPWDSVAEVHTTWCRPGDDVALETTVHHHDGRTIRLSTAMGVTAYWACLSEIVRRAPAGTLSGITDGVLADGPPARQHLVSAIGTAAALALILGALVSVHYLWAQGRSSLARDLERIGAAGGHVRAPGCEGVSLPSTEPGGARGNESAPPCR